MADLSKIVGKNALCGDYFRLPSYSTLRIGGCGDFINWRRLHLGTPRAYPMQQDSFY
jgi:hypothetical protein